MPGKVFTPKRADKKKGYVAGAPMTRLTEFQSTSRQHIAWALQTFRGARFTKVTDTGKPKVDEATMSEIQEVALVQGNQLLHDERDVYPSTDPAEVAGATVGGNQFWFNSIEGDGCIHHSCTLATQTGRNAHRGPNLGQVVSAPWARSCSFLIQGW